MFVSAVRADFVIYKCPGKYMSCPCCSLTLVFAKPAVLLLDHRLSAKLAKAIVTPGEGDPRIRQ